MKVEVTPSACISAGQCVRAAPQVFTQDDEEGVVVLLEPSPAVEWHDAVRAAARLCPARAILVADADDVA